MAWISPSNRIEINCRRELALIQQRENVLLRDPMTTSEQQKSYIKDQYQILRNKQNNIKNNALQHQHEVSKIIGTGCECNARMFVPELELVLNVYGNLPQDVSRLIIEYLPSGSTPRAVLSQQQRYVIQLIMSGHNVFFTGSAGCGKSFILQKLATIPINTIVFTALTGIAAVNLPSASTLHAFAGIGKGEGTIQDLLKKCHGNRFTKERWMRCECLIVDEISMLSAELFEHLDVIARKIRKSELVFGGIQLVFLGDFSQLPPVKATRMCFESSLWNKCFQLEHCIELTKIYRQKDIPFTNLLNEIRIGQVSAKSFQLLKDLERPLCKHRVEATILKTINIDVAAMNKASMMQLQKPIIVFHAQDSGEEPFLEKLKKTCMAEAMLELCENAQVMLIQNLDTKSRLCNGSRGVVTGFQNGVPLVHFMDHDAPIRIDTTTWSINEREKNEHRQYVFVAKATRVQIPLKLAFATTIHKSQGLTLNKISVDIKNVFECGQAYVALSRARDLRSLQVCGFTQNSFKANQACIEFQKHLTRVPEDIVLQLEFHPMGVWSCDQLRNFLADQEEEEVQVRKRKRKS